MSSWSLVNGWLLWVFGIAGGVALAALLATRQHRFWVRRAPVAVAVAAALVLAVKVIVDYAWHPFPDAIPVNNLVWAWAGLSAGSLAIARLPAARWPARSLALASGLVVLVAAAAQINAYWGMYPTPMALRDAFVARSSPTLPAPVPRRLLFAPPAGRTLVDTWRPTASLPERGTVSRTRIPGVASRFRARDAYVYLPPAYLANPRPSLPVIVLLAGQPGVPDHWISTLRLAEVLDTYARTHHGLAPIAVVPDDLGSTTANPLCVDSPLGNVETYLSTDVPNWIRAHIQGATDRASWFIGGYSHGGTCALQLAVRAPAVYGGFVDLSGQREPTLGSRAQTVQHAFGGNAAAFARVNPLDILRHTRFTTTVALISAGTDDKVYLPQQREVQAACQAAGMDVHWLELPGGHTMTLWREAFGQAVPWIAQHGRIAER